MRIVVTGATGNVGTSVVAALGADDRVDRIDGLARRAPDLVLPKTRWIAADVTSADLTGLFRGADAVIHLAWLIQPARRIERLEHVNVGGTRRVLEAVVAAGVPALVYASSVGAYGPGPKEPVDESWPTTGIDSNYYSRQKAVVEGMLDDLEAAHPRLRVVRLRKALVFKREAASGIARLFTGTGPWLRLARPGRIPFLPAHPRLIVQAVHSLDAGEAYRLAALQTVRGAFNIAGTPILDRDTLAHTLSARPVRVSARVLRSAVGAAWRLRLQPTHPSWVDLGLGVPLMDTARARGVLGWFPRFTAVEALLELLDGLRLGDGIATPPLRPAGGRLIEPRPVEPAPSLPPSTALNATGDPALR